MAATKTDDDSAPTQDRVIARLLTDAIVEWRIPPGSWLREREIAARFGVSHAPVREAFRHLARIGLVKVVPVPGPSVIALSAHASNAVSAPVKTVFARRFPLRAA